MVGPTAKRAATLHLQRTFPVSERRACRVLNQARSTQRYVASSGDATEVVARVVDLSHAYPRSGYRKVHWLLTPMEVAVSRERVRRIRRREGLQVVKKRKRKRYSTNTTDMLYAEYPRHVWSYDFVSDVTEDGRTLKCLTVLDEFSRVALAIEVRRSMTSGDVIRVLERLMTQHGTPAFVRSDNGPEFVAKRIQAWLKALRVQTHYIDPGKPWQNGKNESFNGGKRPRNPPVQARAERVISVLPGVENADEREGKTVA